MDDPHEPRRNREPAALASDGPTELVPTEDGEMVERLSGGTATVLLVWLIGVGALSALLAAWLLARLFGQRLGAGQLFSDFGFYVALAGASGPCVLWLAGRAQGHSLGWFLLTAAKIGLVMVGIFATVVLLAILVLAGLPGPGVLAAGGVLALSVLLLSVVWALAVWGADRYIAGARLEG